MIITVKEVPEIQDDLKKGLQTFLGFSKAINFLEKHKHQKITFSLPQEVHTQNFPNSKIRYKLLKPPIFKP